MVATDTHHVIVVGAGPAGLTAAYLLAKRGVAVTVLEADERYVGGISRTAMHAGYRFDIGGHRFFSRSKEVEDFWTEILGDEMIVRPRKSRIYYRRTFFSYPLKPVEALLRLGPVESARCGLSYVGARLRPHASPTNFEEWVSNQFGTRLYEIFFKHYTEKVWGMKCTEISADWASQRIKGLDLWKAVLNALRSGTRSSDEVIKTLIEEFRYPRLGPGQLWERCAERVVELGGTLRMGSKVDGIRRIDGGWRVSFAGTGGHETLEGTDVICSAPLREVMLGLEPRVPDEVRVAAQGLRYRDFLTVALMVGDHDTFDDNWIYVQEPDVKVGRIQNFKSWSPELVPDPSKTCYGLEYFCFEGDGLWTSSDEALIDLAQREMETIGLLDRSKVEDGCVIRQPKAYPIYDDAYARNVETIRQHLVECCPGLHVVGRNGMHRYNNQDHSMMTAMLTVENIVRGEAVYDVFRVNQDAEYIEAGRAGEEDLLEAGGRSVPRRVPSA